MRATIFLMAYLAHSDHFHTVVEYGYNDTERGKQLVSWEQTLCKFTALIGF